MISRDFIHAYDGDFYAESTYEQDMNDIREISGSITLLESQMRDMKFFGTFTESKEEYFEESVASAIEKFGNKIKDMIKRFADFISNAIAKLKGQTWNKMDNDQKILAISKKDPAMAERVRVALTKGDLDMNSFKDLEHFYKESEKLLRDFEKDHPDPRSLRGRWNKIKDNLEKNDKTVSAIKNILGLAVAAGTAYFIFKSWKAKKQEILITEEQRIADMNKANQMKALRNIEALQRMKDANLNGHTSEYGASLAALETEMTAYAQKIATGEINKRLSLYTKIRSQISRIFTGGAGIAKNQDKFNTYKGKVDQNIDKLIRRENDKLDSYTKASLFNSQIPGRTMLGPDGNPIYTPPTQGYKPKDAAAASLAKI